LDRRDHASTRPAERVHIEAALPATDGKDAAEQGARQLIGTPSLDRSVTDRTEVIPYIAKVEALALDDGTVAAIVLYELAAVPANLRSE